MRTSTTKRVKPARPATKAARVRRGSQQDQDALRGEVREVAMALFKAHGLSGVTMRAVAAEVGVSAMALYRYFPNKAGLLRGLWEFAITELHGAMGLAVAGAGPTARARVRAMIDAFFRYFEARPDDYRLMFMTDQAYTEGADGNWTEAPIYREALKFALDMSRELAAEVGGDVKRSQLATDLRLSLSVGYLHSRLINTRYPWVDLTAMRAQAVEQIAVASENCLLCRGSP